MPDPTDHQALETLHDTWIALEREGRYTALPRFLAEDVVVQPESGPPLVGRSQVAGTLFAADGDPVDVDTRILHLSVHGPTAVKIASFRREQPHGEPLHGLHTWFLKKDTEWRITYIAWTFVD